MLQSTHMNENKPNWIDNGEFKVFLPVHSYAGVDFKDRDTKVLHLFINYLRNVGVKPEDIVLVGDNLEALAYGEHYGILTYNTDGEYSTNFLSKAYEKFGKGKHGIFFTNLSRPYLEHNFLLQMQREVISCPNQMIASGVESLDGIFSFTDVIGINRLMLVEDTVDNFVSTFGSFRELYHNRFCSYTILCEEFLADEDVQSAMVNYAFNLNVFQAPTPKGFSFNLPV